MAGRSTIGILFDGDSAEWVGLDASGAPIGSSVECIFERTIPEILAEGGDVAAAAGAVLGAELGSSKCEVSVSLPSDQVLLRMMDLPTTDEREIEGMVALQLDKVSPFPMENMVVSHEILVKGENGVTVAGVGVKRDVVENLGVLLHAAGIVPVRIDVNALVLWQAAVKNDAVESSGRQVLLSMRGATAEFIVIKEGTPVVFRAFMRTDDQSDASFLDEICDELGYTLMSLEIEHGAFDDFSMLLCHSGEMADEALARPRELAGDRLEVVELDLLRGRPDAVATRSAKSGVVDLTPSDLVEERRKLALKRKMLKALAVVGAVWLLAIAAIGGGVLVQNMRLDAVEAEISEIAPQTAEVQELTNKVWTIGLYLDRTRSLLECIREVTMLKPGGVDLTSMQYKKGELFKVTGVAGNVNLVYKYKKDMDASQLFGDVVLEGPSLSRGKHTFEIKAPFPGGPGVK